MIYYLSSKNPANYGSVPFVSSFTPFMASKRVSYRISSLSTIANITVTTDEDFIVINDERFSFTNHGAYDPNMLEMELNSILSPYRVSIRSDGLLSISSLSGSVRISEASHRVKMLLGLYHTELPIEGASAAPEGDWCSDDPSEWRGQVTAVVCPSSPYLCYGNVMYLMARHGPPVGFNGTKNNEEYHCIVYKSSEFMYRGLPIICRHDGVTIRTTAEAFCSLEFTLVDMMLQPIQLMAPLHLTVELSSDDTLIDFISVQ